MERDGRAVFNRFLVGAGSRQAGPAGGSCGAVTAPGSATYSSTRKGLHLVTGPYLYTHAP